MCLTYATQILNIFSDIPSFLHRLYDTLGRGATCRAPTGSRPGLGLALVAVLGPGVRGMYAVSTRRVAILRTAHRTVPMANPTYIFRTPSIAILHMFHTYSIHVPCIFHTCSMHIPYIFITCSIHIP